jgi:hypothetical protein
MHNTDTAPTTDDVLRIAGGLEDLKQRLVASKDYDDVMAIYAALRGLELDLMHLTTLAGHKATKLVMG